MTPRVALFTDCFHEVNGVSLTCRQLDAYARRRGLPLLNVHAGPVNTESPETLELQRGPLRLRFESDLSFDLLFLRWKAQARRALEAFRPDLVHITSPGDFGILGALLAHELRVPLVASWHTNLHEFGARRLSNLLRWAPRRWRESAAAGAERWSLDRLLWFYRIPKLLFAPNPELIDLLRERTGRPVVPMRRGVDCEAFSPAHRNRWDGTLVLGFVGRLRPEKNVRLLARVEAALREAGVLDYRFLVVGDGCERAWLESHLQRAEFTGVLSGRALSRAYASMDLFLFPSTTDTFGNVVQEAMASGVPPVVMPEGGPRFIVRDGETGVVSGGEADFIARTVALAKDQSRREHMRVAARAQALGASWDAVFDEVWKGYCGVGVSRPAARVDIARFSAEPPPATRPV